MKLNAFIVNDNPMEKLLYCFGGDGDSGGSGGGGSDYSADDADSMDSGYDTSTVGSGTNTDSNYGGGGDSDNNNNFYPDVGNVTYPDVSNMYGTEDDFFTGTFDDPGEAGFSGPSYAGQTGYDSDGDYYSASDVGIPNTDAGWSVIGFEPVQTQDTFDVVGNYYSNVLGSYGLDDPFGGLAYAGPGFSNAPITGESNGIPVSDYSMTRSMAAAGYTTRVPSPFETKTVDFPSDYYTVDDGLFGFFGGTGARTPREAVRFDALEAQAFADYLGYDVDIPAEEDYGLIGNALAGIANKVTERFGTSLTDTYIGSPSTGYLGEVFEDYEVTDAIGNLIGMNVPGGAKVDRALTMDITGRKMGAKEYQYSNTIFGEFASLLDPEVAEAQREAQRAADEAERARGTSDPAQGITDPEYRAAVLAATPRSAYLRSLFASPNFGLIAPDFYSGLDRTVSFFRSRFREGGKVEKKAGGGMTPSDNYDKQMYGALSEKPKPAIDPVAVKQNPDAFMMNPMKARDANELREIYSYNQSILDIAAKPLQAQAGMQVGEAQPEPSGDGPVGFVGKKTPETLPEGKTVADDVPLDVEEGTFIINAAAVEFAGSDDIKKMILDAIAEARRQGVDISGDENKIDREKAVSLLVSEGEVVVPPLLAKIIGYDKLNKINNRGKPEVEDRVEENGQSPEAEAIDEQPANPAEGMAMQQGGFAIQGQGSTGETGSSQYKQANVEAEYRGDSFAVKPRVNYDERTSTQEYPDGVIVDEKGKSLGFAVDGQMFLKDDKSLRAGFERQASNSEGRVNLPAEYGGETIEFGGGSKMKRYNMGATFGPVDVDLSKTQVPNGDDVMGGSVRYRFSENGDVTLEATDDGRSGRIGLNYRF